MLENIFINHRKIKNNYKCKYIVKQAFFGTIESLTNVKQFV